MKASALLCGTISDLILLLFSKNYLLEKTVEYKRVLCLSITAISGGPSNSSFTECQRPHERPILYADTVPLSRTIWKAAPAAWLPRAGSRVGSGDVTTWRVEAPNKRCYQAGAVDVVVDVVETFLRTLINVTYGDHT